MQNNIQQDLIRALLDRSVFPHPADDMKLIETHISWVILCGPYAYKIKKALNLGFLDFTTLERRRFYCSEELRLNGRLAPELYLAVVSITGSPEHPHLEGTGEAIEYAVKMRRFSGRGLLSDMVHDNRLEDRHIDQVVTQVARFHLDIPHAPTDTPYGHPQQVHDPVLENFTQILARTNAPEHVQQINHLQDWADREYHRCQRHFIERKQQGFIRECHGDMHLGNIAVIDDVPVIFDGVEFNPDLYWIDVMCEIAFLVMDLEDHDKPTYAYRFLNGYLALTGDYRGVQVLRYYLTYRAAVRAKIASIRLSQELSPDEHTLALQHFERYLQLAVRYTQPQHRVLLITHGLSGSGKSTLSEPLSEQMGALRVRSDRERQRLFGKGASAGGAAGIDSGVYAQDASQQTYATLEDLSAGMLEAGFPVIVDATFLARVQRDQFQRLADRLSVPLRILHFHAAPDVLQQRIAARQHDGQDISEADLDVLAHQLATYQPLEADERGKTVFIDTELKWRSPQIKELIIKSLSEYQPSLDNR